LPTNKSSLFNFLGDNLARFAGTSIFLMSTLEFVNSGTLAYAINRPYSVITFKSIDTFNENYDAATPTPLEK
jgi:hypothetical protein